MASGYHYQHTYNLQKRLCATFILSFASSRHDCFAVAAYKDEEMIDVVGQRPKLLKGRILRRLEHASRTGVSEKIWACACNEDVNYICDRNKRIHYIQHCWCLFWWAWHGIPSVCKLIGDTGKPQTILHQHPTMQICVSKYSMQH